MLAFDYRRLGESGGQPRQVVRIGDQLADWQAAIAFARTLPGVDPAKVAIWGFSLSGGHIFHVGGAQPRDRAQRSRRRRSSTARPATRNAARYQTPVALLRLTGRGLLDAVGGLFGRDPCWCRSSVARGTVAMLIDAGCPQRRPSAQPRQPIPGLAAEVAARSALRIGFYRPGRGRVPGRVPLLVCRVRRGRARPGRAVRRSRATRSPRRRSSECRAGTTSPSWADTNRPSRSSCPSCAGTCWSRRRPAPVPPTCAARGRT